MDWTNDELIDILAEFLAEPLTDNLNAAGGVNEYAKWREYHVDRHLPCAATIRNRFGKWSIAKGYAVERLYGEEG